MRGSLGYDSISLSPSEAQVLAQPFLLLNGTKYQENRLNADGVVVSTIQGLGFSKHSDGYSTLLDSLKSQGVIDQKVFAFYLSQNSDRDSLQSALSFGSWNLTKYSVSPDFVYVHIIQDYGLWIVFLTHFSICGSPGIEPNLALVSSDLPLILLSTDSYWKLLLEICQLVVCDLNTELISFNCTEEIAFPDLAFTLERTEFTLPAKFYIQQVRNKCVVLVQESPIPACVLGAPFFRAYYMLFDAENYRIGLARSVNYPISAGISWWKWVIAGVAIGVVALGLIFLLYRREKRRTAESLQPLMQKL